MFSTLQRRAIGHVSLKFQFICQHFEIGLRQSQLSHVQAPPPPPSPPVTITRNEATGRRRAPPPPPPILPTQVTTKSPNSNETNDLQTAVSRSSLSPAPASPTPISKQISETTSNNAGGAHNSNIRKIGQAPSSPLRKAYKQNVAVLNERFNSAAEDQSLAGKDIVKIVMNITSALIYNSERTPWVLTLRKEAFLPGDDSEQHPVAVHMIFHQVVHDIFQNYRRIPPTSLPDAKEVLAGKGIAGNAVAADDSDKKEVTAMAKKWPVYFVRNYQVVVDGQDRDDTYYLAVGHNGVHMVKERRRVVQQTGRWVTDVEIKVSDSYGNVTVDDWQVSPTEIIATLSSVRYTFTTRSGSNIKQLVEAFILDSGKDATHAVALKAYETRDATLLSFPKDAIITLTARTGLDPGWFYGTFGGRTGAFPASYSAPIVGEVTQQSIDAAKRAHKLRNQDSRIQMTPAQMRMTKRGMSSKALTSAAMGHAPGHTVRTRGAVLEDEELLSEQRFSLLQFAKDNFRLGQDLYEMQRTESGSVRGTVKRVAPAGKDKKKKKKKDEVGLSWSWSELAALVKFTKSPIQASLLKLNDSESHLNKLALESFINIMRFMGDYMAKGKTEADVIEFLLRVVQQHPPLRNEIYCQLLKQVTNNKSERLESCARGWRLLVIITSYAKPSADFEPYLKSYLQAIAYNPQREYRDEAAICLQNVKATVRYGGRAKLPNRQEVLAVIQGKFKKIQKLYLPGDRTKSIKVHASIVVKDVLQDMCQKMNNNHPEEFGLFVQTNPARQGVLLNKHDYILDITTIFEEKNVPFRLYFKKRLWFFPSSYTSIMYTSMVFAQVVEDFVKGHLLVTAQCSPMICNSVIPKLLTLRHFAVDPEPSLSSLLETYTMYVPPQVEKALTAEEWSEELTSAHNDYNGTLPHDAETMFLKIAEENFELFGSRFFDLERVSDRRIQGPARLAINRHGIRFLQTDNNETILSYNFNEIVSTRKLGSKESKKHFLDFKLGNLMVQRVTRCETRQGIEIQSIISTYIGLSVDQHREKAMRKS
eukprot:gene1592-4733_t